MSAKKTTGYTVKGGVKTIRLISRVHKRLKAFARVNKTSLSQAIDVLLDK